ncbi:MAG: conserved rane protein of unknown function, putative glycosyltransferase [Bacteroidetes bacterium]|nr:conserved rane protein of unknown function, putative glycosyltransferase [Bacteroidota bacterium]
MVGRPRALIGVLIVGLAFIVGLIQIETTPPLWWDEGWTVLVARNWVEHGHYGYYLAGIPSPPELAGHLPVVAPIALSFKLFGIGIWQARVAILVLACIALLLFYVLVEKLFSHSIAVATLIILLLLPPKWGLHPLFLGRQALGEMPSIFYLVAGYICFLTSTRRPSLLIPAAIFFWGIALMTKVQVVPFVAASMVMPMLLLAVMRQWRAVRLLAICLIGSYVAWALLRWAQHQWLTEYSMPMLQLTELVTIAGLVFDPSIRIHVLAFAITFGLPALLGLSYGIWCFVEKLKKKTIFGQVETTRLMLLSLAVSWFGWFVLFSVGWERYAFPGTFLAAPFVAQLLHDFTDGFRILPTVQYAIVSPLKRKLHWQSLRAVGVVCLVGMMCFLTAEALIHFHESVSDSSVKSVSQFINTATRPGALIESDDPEIFFLLDRPYHYAPPRIDVEYMLRTWGHKDVQYSYDALAADPDYLVVGSYGAESHLYDSYITNGAFKPLKTFGRYSVYERTR